MIENFLNHPRIHLTCSQKRLLKQYVSEICIREEMSVKVFLKDHRLNQIIETQTDPVQKGKKIFEMIRKKRYPVSEGKNENPIQKTNYSKNIASLNSKTKLVNPYFYGDGVFDLQEYVISLIRSCPLDCAYCFVNEIYDDPRFKIEPDYQKIKDEIKEIQSKEKGIVYLNAGENADSLIHDAEFDLTSNLWKIIKPFKNIFLEFRTKTDQIQNLLRIKDHERRIVCAFSLSPEEDRKLFEKKTASISKRIEAMKILEKEGWSLGLRFEPIIVSKNYEEKYRELFENIFTAITPNVHSITLSCLRLTKGLAKLLRKSHPEILAEEWILGRDKKLRYCREIRTEIYKNLLHLLKPYLPESENVLLSTEPVEIWKESGLTPKTMPEISLKNRPNIS